MFILKLVSGDRVSATKREGNGSRRVYSEPVGGLYKKAANRIECCREVENGKKPVGLMAMSSLMAMGEQFQHIR